MITKHAYTHLVTVGTYVFKTILEKEKAIEAMENMQERAEDYDFHCDTEVMRTTISSRTSARKR